MKTTTPSFTRDAQSGDLSAVYGPESSQSLPISSAIERARNSGRQISTPFYVYNLNHIRHRFRALHSSLRSRLQSPFQIHYAVKANANRKVLHALKEEGACVDVVSQGEGERAMESGFSADQVLFSGVGKTKSELNWALKSQVHQINVESSGELIRLCGLSESLGAAINIGFRLNPNVCPETHPYITTGLRENKFGLEALEIIELVQWLKEKSALHRVRLRGLSLHIGSQLLNLDPLAESIAIARDLQNRLQKDFALTMDRFDVGGGLGIDYTSKSAPEASALDAEVWTKAEESEIALTERLSDILHSTLETGSDRLAKDTQLLLEPGRWLVARSGALITEVQYLKKNPYKTFVIVDAGMHNLMRPSLYEAYHRIEPLRRTDAVLASDPNSAPKSVAGRNSKSVQSDAIELCDVVGPICESADFLGRDRDLSGVKQGDLLAVLDSGAYGYSMASLYNLRGWPGEWTMNNGELE